MKKNFNLSLALVLTAVLFGGCANLQPKKTAQPESKTAVQTKPAPAVQPAPKAEKKSASKKVAASAEVKALQEALDKAGYKVKADGRMGPMTRAALNKYQKANGLKVTGKFDQATKAKLGVK